jgi:hypothetical protein
LLLSNLLHAFRTKRLPENTLAVLFDKVLAIWTTEGGRAADTIVEHIVDEQLANFLCHASAVSGECCSRVTDDKSLVGHNIDYRELGFPFVDDVPPSLLTMLEAGIPPGGARNFMRGERPFAWVTATNRLRAVIDEHRDDKTVASTVRDVLGLSDYGADQLLVEIVYPDAVIKSLPLAPPTFFEGGVGVVFRAKSATDGWGRTVNLRTHDDGLPEGVHAPIPFTEDFRVRRIGRIDRQPGFVFEEVIARAEYPWTRDAGRPAGLPETGKLSPAI